MIVDDDYELLHNPDVEKLLIKFAKQVSNKDEGVILNELKIFKLKNINESMEQRKNQTEVERLREFVRVSLKENPYLSFLEQVQLAIDYGESERKKKS